MDLVIYLIKNSYGLSLLAFLMALVGAGLIWKRPYPAGTLFRYYLLFYALEMVIDNIIFVLTRPGPAYETGALLVRLVDLLFTLFELFVFARYLKTCLGPGPGSRWVNLLSGSFVGMVAVLLSADFVRKGSFTWQTQQMIFLLQSVYLLVFCLMYFRNFMISFRGNYRKEPSFWIFSGLALFVVSTLPFSFFLEYLFAYDYKVYTNFFSLFFLFYAVLFYCIVRAFYLADNEGVRARRF